MTKLPPILHKLPQKDEFRKVPTHANNVYVGDRLVLKMYDSLEEWKNTIQVYRLIHSINLEAPIIIAFEQEPEPYILMSKLPGVPIGEDQSLENYRSLGEWTGKLHTITFDRFGGIQERGTGPFYEIECGPFADWKTMHLKLIQNRIKSFSGSPLAELEEEILAFFGSYPYPDFKPSLIHEDLNQKNIFVKHGRITGVIDPDGGYAGCTEEELMRIEEAHFIGREDFRQAFLQEYQKHHPLLRGYEHRRALFRLSRTLVEAQFLINNPDYKSDHREQAMQHAIDRIVSLIRGTH